MPGSVAGPGSGTAVDVVLSCGHESGGGRALSGLLPDHRAVPAGGELGEAVGEALDGSERPVCVVPMTLGRDPGLIADSARALRWVAGVGASGRVALAEPFGTADHLIGWLRAAATRVPPQDGARRALLITAPAADPFADADLFRIARLVRQYGRHRWVEVAFAGGDPDIDEGVDRCRRLGADRVTLIPGWFGPCRSEKAATQSILQVDDGGPLLTPSAVRGVVAARVATTLNRLALGDDGILAGLGAEHGHGYTHTHGPEEGGHPHTHTHHHGHSHTHH